MSKIFTIDSNYLIVSDILVKGEVHISGNLDIMDLLTMEYATKNVDNSGGILTITGNLYIESDEVLVKEAIAYSNMKILPDETFDINLTINNVYITTERLIVCGKISSENNITYYSTKVHNKIKREKINKLKTIIKNK
jgi:hypothetical protein